MTIGQACLTLLVLTTAAPAELMPLAELERGLAAHPPRLGGDQARRPLFQALDDWAMAPDTVYWDSRPETANPDYLAFYLRRVQRVLDELPATAVGRGAAIWKLYSSGVVLKTVDTVLAFDVVEGPFKSILKSPDGEPGFTFHWTPAMRARFAELVDVLFISHWHYDHTSFALVEALVAAGKTVVVTAQLQRRWSRFPWADRLTTLEPATDTPVGKLMVRSFDGVQYMEQDADRNWVSAANKDAQNNVLLGRASDGTTFLQNGDNRGRPFDGWLREAVAAGWHVDVWFIPLFWPHTLLTDIEAVCQPILIPVHEHELGHKPAFGVNRLMSRVGGTLGQRLQAGRAVAMAWGERWQFTPAGHR